MPFFSSKTARHGTILATALVGFAICGSAAHAQGYSDSRYGEPGYAQDDTLEGVEVTAPRYYHGRSSTTGAPIENVAMRAEVSYSDLDLRTGYGANTLRHRIVATANQLCQRLDRKYPITATDSPDCRREAVQDAMYQADVAIRDARR